MRQERVTRRGAARRSRFVQKLIFFNHRSFGRSSIRPVRASLRDCVCSSTRVCIVTRVFRIVTRGQFRRDDPGHHPHPRIRSSHALRLSFPLRPGQQRETPRRRRGSRVFVFHPEERREISDVVRSSKFRRLSASSRDDDASSRADGFGRRGRVRFEVGVVVDVDGGTAARARPGGANDCGGVGEKLASRADVHQGGVVRDLQARAVGDGRLDGRWSESERESRP